MLNKFIHSLFLLLILITPVFADVQVQDDGTNVGIVTKLNFTGGTVTKSGQTATVPLGGGDSSWIGATGKVTLATPTDNVGVGSLNPEQKLVVNGTAKATAFIGDGSGLTGISGGGGWTDGTNVVYPTVSSDNVAIGTTAATSSLEIYNGNITFNQLKQPSTPTVATGAAGVLNGSYKYCVSYYTSAGETRCSSASSTVSPSSQQVTVTIPVSTETVTGRKIYRSLANATSEATGHLVAFLVTTIADNSTTSYSDNNSDTTIQGNGKPIWNTSISPRTYLRNSTGTIETGFLGQDDYIAGYQAGHSVTLGNYSGWQNTLVGAQTGYHITSALRNSAFGYNSLNSNQNGDFNSGFGTWTLYGLVSGDNNSAFDHGSLENMTLGSDNTAYGFYSMYSLGLKDSGSSYGSRSAFGQLVTAISDYSGTVAGTVRATTTNAHPYQTGDIVRIGGTETYDGVYTVTVIDTTHFYFTATYTQDEGGLAESNFSGAANTAASANVNDTNGNIFVGYYCAQKQAWGQYNTFIGYKARYENGSFGDSMNYSGCIGAECHVAIDNAFVIGSDKTAASTYYGFNNVGLNVRRPIYSLTFNGTKEDSILGVNRNQTTAGAAGKALSIRAGGATVNGSISALNKTPTAGGTGYVMGDILTISTGGTGATVRVVEVDAGVVKIVQLLNEGTGYTTGTGKSTTGGTGSGCTVNITTVRSATDLAGGDLKLYSGISTGTGSSAIHVFTYPATGSSAVDNTATERLTILSNGNIGIGTVIPEVGFTVSGKSIRQKSTNVMSFGDDGNADIKASATTSGDLHFRTGGNVRMSVSTNVGIGSTSPREKLEVNGNIRPTGYKSSDGTSGVTVTTCTSFKDGLCVAGT